MSKPQAIEYKLIRWDITWDGQYFESSAATGTQHYQATIVYRASVGEKTDNRYIRQNFEAFDEAKSWIEREIS